MLERITKRDGTAVPFEPDKIKGAITKAFISARGSDDEDLIDRLTKAVVRLLKVSLKDKPEDTIINVEEVQDAVETILIKYNLPKVAKEYILFRDCHNKIRKTKDVMINAQTLVGDYIDKLDWRVNENANSGYSYASMLNHISGSVVANYTLSNIYPERIAKAHRDGDFHIHDLSAGIIPYCMGHSLKELLMMGFVGSGGRASSKPAKHLDSALQQISNFMATLQTEAAGAQAFSSWDTYLAPFVRNDGLTYQQVKQAVQQFIFGLNIASRWGQCLQVFDTQVLTENGEWVDYYQLKVGERIVTPDPNTNMWKTDTVKAIQMFEGIHKMHRYTYAENKDMSRMSFAVTSNHRVAYRTSEDQRGFLIEESNNIYKHRKVLIPIGIGGNKDPDYPISDNMLKFLTFILCDGCIVHAKGRSPRIDFYKTDTRWGRKEFEELLNNLQIPYGLRVDKYAETHVFRSTCYRYMLKKCEAVATAIDLLNGTKKHLPELFKKLSQRQINIVFDLWIKLDGYVDRDSYKRLQCDTEQIQNDICALAIKAGYGCRKHEHIIGKNKRPTKYVYIYNHINRMCGISEELYYGKVWCPTTDTGTIVVRLKSTGHVFITGNCPFTNLTMDLVPPSDLKDMPVIIGGELQDTTYGEYQTEMDMLNKAFIETMIEGDAEGKIFTFPIPTYNIVKDFDWEGDVAKKLFELTCKFGSPYFANYLNSDMNPSDSRSMCCRLRLDLKELRRKNGGLFGSGELTGSSGVCTINMPRIGYLASNKEEFFSKLEYLMVLAKDSLEIKRKIAQANIDNGLLPYTKIYVKSLKNHFSTIGLVGLNEACLNLLGCDLTTPEGQDFGVETLEFMRSKMSEFQEETGNLFNLEGVPAEATAYRLAKIDKEKFGDIITAGTDEVPYYTNSSQIPVGYTDDIFEACDLQDRLQPLYTGGIVQHLYLGERIEDPAQAAKLIKKLCENYKIPYFSLTPTFSICKVHGYIPGNHSECPYDKDDVIEKPAK